LAAGRDNRVEPPKPPQPTMQNISAAEVECSLPELQESLRKLEAEHCTLAEDRAACARRRELQKGIRLLRRQVELVSFRQRNKTSFTAGASAAVLGVTSGLALPTEPLPSLPTAEMLEQLADHALVDVGGKSAHPEGERMLSDGHEHGFIKAVTAAFQHHYPLALRPQHFLLLVAQGVAAHVDQHAEAVRAKWVAHEGKKTLTVRCDGFVLGRANAWASTVSGKMDSFSVQIAASTAEGVAELLAPPFSSTSHAEDIAGKVVVMGICKHFFEYKCQTLCGFPEITLEGTLEDWRTLRGVSERMLARCTTEFEEKWGAALLPLLDKLVAARQGEVDAPFWNSMCKRGGTIGSGARTWFNGWFNVFFPYLRGSPNPHCVPYSPSAGYVLEGLQWDARYGMFEGKPPGVAGPDCEDFPSGMSAVPVKWEYYSTAIPLSFNAGFAGAVQDPVSLQIRPQIAWYITNLQVMRESLEKLEAHLAQQRPVFNRITWWTACRHAGCTAKSWVATFGSLEDGQMRFCSDHKRGGDVDLQAEKQALGRLMCDAESAVAALKLKLEH